MKKSSPWITILLMLLSLLFASCQPYMTYDEMNDAHDIATDPVVIEALEKRIDKFEKHVVNADKFFEERANCSAQTDTLWYCREKPQYNDRHPPETLDERVKVYRRDRHVCRCASNDLSQIFY